jgi:hypothetical protein
MSAQTEIDRVQCEQELETPVTAPDLEIPRASEFALSSLEIAESAAVEIPAPVQEVPRSLAEALALIRALNAAPHGADKTLRKAHGVLLEHARADWHRLAQSPKPPPLDVGVHLRGLRTPPPEAIVRIQSRYPNGKKS